MAEQKFRSALNGFNREDVVHYIEFLNSKHAAELNQLRTENEELREQAQQQPAEDLSGRVAQLEDRCMELEQLNLNAQTELEEAQEQRQQLEERIAALQEALEQATANARQQAAQSVAADELEAYRRAERVERNARERAEQLYQQATGTLAEATTQVDNAAEQLRCVADRVNEQIGQLQIAIAGSKNTLAEAAAAMYRISPVRNEE